MPPSGADGTRRPRMRAGEAQAPINAIGAAPLAASIIVALNPHDADPRAVFAGYLAQTFAPAAFEVIVVDGGTRPNFAAAYAEHVRAFPNTPIRTITVPAPGR